MCPAILALFLSFERKESRHEETTGIVAVSVLCKEREKVSRRRASQVNQVVSGSQETLWPFITLRSRLHEERRCEGGKEGEKERERKRERKERKKAIPLEAKLSYQTIFSGSCINRQLLYFRWRRRPRVILTVMIWPSEGCCCCCIWQKRTPFWDTWQNRKWREKDWRSKTTSFRPLN